jgi:hypothetical protein
MPIFTTCPSCGHERQIPDQYAGKKIKCSTCGKRVIVPELVPVLELAPCQAKRKRAFPVWPIIVGSFVFLSCIGLLLFVSVMSAPRMAPNQANQTEPFAQEGPIQIGKFRIDWTKWSIGQLSMHDVHGIGVMHVTRDECFRIEFKIENLTDTEILNFPGLRQCEPVLEDAFGNSYRQIKREPGYEWSGALFDESYVGEHGDPIHPGKPRKDYLTFEPPLVKAEQLRLVLSARPLGGGGTVRLLILSHQKTDQEKDAEKEANWKERLKGDPALQKTLKDHPDWNIAGEPEALRKERQKGLKKSQQ